MEVAILRRRHRRPQVVLKIPSATPAGQAVDEALAFALKVETGVVENSGGPPIGVVDK